jgi:hypothetical protein
MRRWMARTSLGCIAAVLGVSVAGCRIGVEAFPDRVLDPEVAGVVVEREDLADTLANLYRLEDGTEFELDRGEAVELVGGSLGEGRMLIVARDGEQSYYLGLARTEEMTSDPNCYGLYGTDAAWMTPDGIVFRFAAADIGLRLRAHPGFDPATHDDGNELRRVEQFCVTPDGRVRGAGG